jgi:predicted RND superfamily exporter protein
MGISAAWEGIVDNSFEKIGRTTSKRPWLFIFLSILVGAGMASGFARLQTESRPEKQWVPSGSPALEYNEYVLETWNSSMRMAWHILTCKTEGCNVLDKQHIEHLQQKYTDIRNLKLDGNWFVDSVLSSHEADFWGGADLPNETLSKYRGTWSLGKLEDDSVAHGETKRKCFDFGPVCATQLLTSVFGDDDKAISRLTPERISVGINNWEAQTKQCSVSIARSDSPCVDTTVFSDDVNTKADDCKLYNSIEERDRCRGAIAKYCETVCPTQSAFGTDGLTYQDEAKCEDDKCFHLAENPFLSYMMAMDYEPWKMEKMLGGIERDGAGQITKATSVFGFTSLKEDPVYPVAGSDPVDPLAEWWEQEMLCVFGVVAAQWNETHATPMQEKCPEDPLFKVSAMAGRSFGDTFGAAVTGDVMYVGISYMAMFVYLVCTLSRRDHVHSAWGMSCAVLVAVGLAFGAGMGVGAYLGLLWNQLNLNIPFLLLGLGVDDAFVLCAEFSRATKADPEMPVHDRCALACRHGGVSIFVTSLTDALAFLIGSMTVLPALSWFCAFSGLCIVMIFIFQLTFILPCIALNAERAESGRFDCCCCCKTKEPRPITDPKGCCCCLFYPGYALPKADFLERVFIGFGEKVVKQKLGKAAVLVFFTTLSVVGLYGTTQLYADFRLEWFIPDGSYVTSFLSENDQMFSAGVPFNVYTREIDYFEKQQELSDISQWMKRNPLIDQNEEQSDWVHAFEKWVVTNNFYDRTYPVPTKQAFYTMLHDFFRSDAGSKFQSNVQWMNTACDEYDDDQCGAIFRGQGLKATRLGANIVASASRATGMERYDAMLELRRGIAVITGDSSMDAGVFVHSRDFLYWEENGVIQTELVRNLVICTSVILVIIFLMIPRPWLSAIACYAIFTAMINTLGFCYFWDVTINGVSTIYVLICVGLAVDYSIHMVHCFNHTYGTSEERAVIALGHMGPCIFHAFFTLFLATLVVGFSVTFVFRMFFKCFFLVGLFGGSHGLFLLPTLLAIAGGDNPGREAGPTMRQNDAAGK